MHCSYMGINAIHKYIQVNVTLHSSTAVILYNITMNLRLHMAHKIIHGTRVICEHIYTIRLFILTAFEILLMLNKQSCTIQAHGDYKAS